MAKACHKNLFFALLLFCFFNYCFAFGQKYLVSDEPGLGRAFDGFGGLSAGASSKLLYAYREPQRSQILDYLFKPNFGASLQILKVEIGGDDQSTDGVESSHMHDEWEESYDRGYEWWLMIEAKKRNPDIKLHGLPWAFPGWLGTPDNPFVNLTKTAVYITKWILGAKNKYNLTIDYIGIWNEKVCNLDYVIVLRQILNLNNLTRVKIVACDGGWDDLYDVLKNDTLRKTVDILGVHYPAAFSPAEFIDSNMTLWSSEDYSTYADNIGAGCWVRDLNQNYVNGSFTSTISWSLIAAFYKGLVCEGQGLTTAVEPWSGNYEVKNAIWMTAHTTQFTKIGWKYLKHGYGASMLKRGGSYIALTNDKRTELTIVVETMTYNHSMCSYHNPPPYTIKKQKAVFCLGGSFAHLKKLHLWQTKLHFSDRRRDQAFKYIGTTEVLRSRVYLTIEPDTVYTLTTINTGRKGDHGPSPTSAPFPLPYVDDFQNYSINQEPYLLSPQTGVWEVRKDNTSDNQYARQVVLGQPVAWIALNPYPLAVIGDALWTDIALSARVRFPSVNGSDHIFLSIRNRHVQCITSQATGIFFWLYVGFRTYAVSSDIGAQQILDAGFMTRESKIVTNTWYNVSISIQNWQFSASVDGVQVTSVQLTNISEQGFAAIGTGGWGYADFDDLRIDNS